MTTSLKSVINNASATDLLNIMHSLKAKVGCCGGRKYTIKKDIEWNHYDITTPNGVIKSTPGHFHAQKDVESLKGEVSLSHLVKRTKQLMTNGASAEDLASLTTSLEELDEAGNTELKNAIDSSYTFLVRLFTCVRRFFSFDYKNDLKSVTNCAESRLAKIKQSKMDIADKLVNDMKPRIENGEQIHVVLADVSLAYKKETGLQVPYEIFDKLVELIPYRSFWVREGSKHDDTKQFRDRLVSAVLSDGVSFDEPKDHDLYVTHLKFVSESSLEGDKYLSPEELENTWQFFYSKTDDQYCMDQANKYAAMTSRKS